MKLSELTDYLESIAPLAYQESYDNCGLLIGNKSNSVSAAIIALDVTESVIDEAIDKRCNVIIAHHPLIFGGLKKINGNNYVERCVIKAIKNDIAIYAIHTNFDNVMDGVNAMIADKLALSERRILQPKKQTLSKLVTFVPHAHLSEVQTAIWEAGAGNIGNYSECSFAVEGLGTFKGNDDTTPFVGAKNVRHTEPETRLEVIFPNYRHRAVVSALKNSHPYEEVAYETYELTMKNSEVGAGMIGVLPKPMQGDEWLAYLKQQMQLSCIRYTAAPNQPISRVAVCGGSGSFLLNDAISSQADVFVTGDFKYHEFFNAENQLMICDIGHYESERFTSELLLNKLLNKFPTFAAQISSINTNPVNYY